MSEKNHNVSRRQFLTYTLMGVGGFMGAAMVMPMVRFAVDPILQADAAGDMNELTALSDLTEEPQAFSLTYEVEDGWVTQTMEDTVWAYLSGDEVIALSPTCTHLGCTVNFGGDENNPDQFFCPCHFGRFEIDGTNVPGTPPTEPLHRYDTEIRDGVIYVGRPQPQQ
ncbi:menaquinone-cytochrome c reductase iron-sulfur subunit [Geomicrobium sp. JCM 19055]|nr:menaquinone-cytochrome c reductase iron-sulfur subunit [Geomicrobium sp. JCM 19055]